MRSMVFFLVLVFAVSVFCYGQMETTARHLLWSPQGKQVVVSDFSKKQFLLLDSSNFQTTAISGTLTGGQMAVWCHDNNTIGFKIVQKLADGSIKQAPAIYQIDAKKVTVLHPLATFAGNPSFSLNGKIAFTIGKNLHILRLADFYKLHQTELPNYVNLVALSPDGTKVVYSNKNDHMFIYSLLSGTHRKIISSYRCFAPKWNHNGSKILVSTIQGEALVVDAHTFSIVNIGKMDNPRWNKDGKVIAIERSIKDQKLQKAQLVEYDRGQKQVLLVKDKMFFATVNLQQEIFYCMEKDFFKTSLKTFSSKNRITLSPTETIKIPSLFEVTDNTVSSNAKKVIRGVPYVHQVWCTDFSKAVSCGATSAIMILGYYGKLSHWDFVALTPFSHTSHFGNYVSKQYSFGKHIFDKWGAGSSVPTYGGHGYIWQVPVNTKNHMAKFIQAHNIDSSVDWRPTWEKLQQKVDTRQPFVILTSITSSGHYKTVVGYHPGQHTLIVNDPYGNKNEGYGKFNGACVSYDWPGYNNGYQSLNQVHCYIYANGTAPTEEAGTVENPFSINNFPYQHSYTTATSNGTDQFDLYNTSNANEKGREITYKFTVMQAGTLKASIKCDQAVDIDLHLLSSPNANSCIVRAHESFSQKINPGTYYLVCDTFVGSSGHEFMGDYTLKCEFVKN